jgi:hypothetical protein
MFRLFPPKDKTAFILKITIEDLNSYYADKEEGKIKSNNDCRLKQTNYLQAAAVLADHMNAKCCLRHCRAV